MGKCVVGEVQHRTTNQDYGAFYYRVAAQHCIPDALKAKKILNQDPCLCIDDIVDRVVTTMITPPVGGAPISVFDKCSPEKQTAIVNSQQSPIKNFQQSSNYPTQMNQYYLPLSAQPYTVMCTPSYLTGQTTSPPFCALSTASGCVPVQPPCPISAPFQTVPNPCDINYSCNAMTKDIVNNDDNGSETVPNNHTNCPHVNMIPSNETSKVFEKLNALEVRTLK
ncbi:unnamed protein product [Didymodactylos carnosus]|uniref:Uncharacterized protein n=1 Tax=Didymodactylos carnosus TaxID=1234261 RepID=A0A814XPQ2_9BILA|nr:unnamed protein product [Didymodactylos carnosus]CAF1216186.1 unnamed protein product [Didymodactylos carnosus]CAF3649747.1 unnamed protein product [Didymodactylos carnosus]CAF3979956.1 unnamed protein product [Didymodactylos carnosus]